MGAPKHELRLSDGRTMLEAVAGALSQVCAQVVVVGHAPTSLRRVADLRPGQGPLGGLEALLASGLDTEYLVCPCDLPLITPALLRLLTGDSARPATVFRVDGEDDFWPLPARIAEAALGPVRDHLDRGERAVHELMRALGPELIPVSRPQATVLANVNTPADYEALKRASSTTNKKANA